MLSLEKKILFFLMSSLLLFSSATLVYGATLSEIDAQIEMEERKRKELDQKLEAYKSTIQQMKVKENDLLVKIDRSQQDTEKARQEMAILDHQIAKLQKAIVALSEDMAQAKSRINTLVTGLKHRMVEISKYGTSEELNLIFSAESTHEILDSIYLMNQLSRHDQFLIEQLQAKRQELAASQRSLENHRDKLKSQLQALDQERQTYNSTIKQTNTILNDIRRQKALAERAAWEMEESQVAVGQTILALMKKKSSAGKVDYIGGRMAQGRGSMFDWPLRGPISSPFGTRVHPVFKTRAFHSGLDIAAPRGTPVKAAAPGEVLFEGWMRGYGQVIIIDHGREYSTVYAHMSSTRVKEGAVVGAGTVVGTVGDTGTTTGYHLHFEVRVGSAAKNPLDYLKR